MKNTKTNFEEDHKAIIEFVNETKDGKYTVQKPKIEFSFQRIEVQEQDEFIDIDEYQENSYLFGFSS